MQLKCPKDSKLHMFNTAMSQFYKRGKILTVNIWLAGKRGHGHTDIENTDMENADMENADMENADMENADMENADMENTDMENTDMENTDMENTVTI